MNRAVQELPMLVNEPVGATRLEALEAKLDSLTLQVARLGEQLELLVDEAAASRRRRSELEDLQTDLMPVVRDLYDVTVTQLEEIQAYVQLEDVLNLFKRLARNTRSLNDLLDQVESLRDLWHDLSPVTKEMFDQAVTVMDDLERRGYFGFARQGGYVLDQIVTTFGEDDVRLLGDNIVTILNTVKALTQPEMMNLVSNLTQAYTEADQEALPTGVWGLMTQMRDPQVRRGLAITMAMLKRVAQQTPAKH